MVCTRLSAIHETSLTDQLFTPWHRAVCLLSLQPQAESYTLPAFREVSMRSQASVAKTKPDVAFNTTKYFVGKDGNIVKEKHMKASVRL